MSDVSLLVDRLGSLEARINELQGEADGIRKVLVKSKGVIVGSLFRATISSYIRETLATKLAVPKLKALGVSHQWLTSHLTKTPITAVKVVPIGFNKLAA